MSLFSELISTSKADQALASLPLSHRYVHMQVGQARSIVIVRGQKIYLNVKTDITLQELLSVHSPMHILVQLSMQLVLTLFMFRYVRFSIRFLFVANLV